MKIRRSIAWGGVLMAILGMLLIPKTVYATSNEPARVIHVVYDDSGSMISDNAGNKCDTWCQAKYAMEVFSAMLEENDLMKVYVMSDFQKLNDAEAYLTLRGKDGSESNVEKIHNMLTPAANYTTFTTVEKAYADLQNVKDGEKWLVVLTDGAFNKPAKTDKDLEQWFYQKSDDIKIMFLGMGPKAATITQDEEHNIYFEKAETSSDILSKISQICNRIFNSNMLEVDVDTGKFEFDVPMGELVVFAQGEGVKVNSVKDAESKKLDGESQVVRVQYSEQASTDETGKYADPIIDTNLVGTIHTYKGGYDIGEYVVDAENAKTIEVYYKPDIEIMAFLEDGEGNEIGADQTVEPGEYTLNFSFVKPGTNQKIEQSKLLGEVSYSAHMTGAGADSEKLYVSGDKVTLSEGNYLIDASAELPQFYTTVSTQLSMDVFWHRQLQIVAESNPIYEIDKDTREKIDGFVNADDPTIIDISFDGEQLSAEQWEKMPVPTIEQISKKDFRVDFIAEKKDVGKIYVYPYLKSGKTDILGDYHDIEIKASFNVEMSGEAWDGEVTQMIPIVDNRPWYWKHLDKAWKLAVLAFIVFIILGYTPMFKRYLPKKLKSQPTIDCKPNRPGQRKYERKGRYIKNRVSTLIPYKAETGTIKFIPSGVAGPPSLKVKATESGRRMDVVNTSAYGSARGLTFNGNPVDKNSKKNISLSASALIVYKTADTTYSCTLNR